GRKKDEMELKKELDPNLTSYEDTDVENNLTYYYSVTAFNDQGESLEEDIIEATPRAEPVVPSSPKDVTAEVLDEGVEVTWNKPSDDGGSSITSYKIYRQRSEDELKLLSEVEAGTSKHLDKNVDPGTDYTYAVTAINEVGKSERSYTDTVTVPEDHSPEPVRPSSPREVTAEVLDEGVELIWDQPLDDGGSPITTYKIYKAKDGGELEYLVEVENGTMSYLDKEVEGGSNYTYAVTAVNEVGESERNNAETTTVTLSEDYEPVPSDEEDGGWLEQINESDIPLIPILIVLVALISLVIIAVALRKRR
ncbi:MAG: fibronectin type III domain-containing protein, partial [Candidatus Thermoplasmatota archaeon]|nr:fibronectin type III domain-containing protein [Candidatus Thermoplasmatota archaeon]